MTPGITTLSRLQIRRVSVVVNALVEQHGGTAEAAQAAIGVGHVTLDKFRGKRAGLPSTLRPVRGTLELIAKAAGDWTVEQLLAGEVLVAAPIAVQAEQALEALEPAPVGPPELWRVALAQTERRTELDLEQAAAAAIVGAGIVGEIMDAHVAASSASQDLCRALQTLRAARLELERATGDLAGVRVTAERAWAADEQTTRAWIAEQGAALERLVEARAQLSAAAVAA